jgi:4-amino-4-deoxy-L-arabinose transferase-like glycosyltransferase
MPGSGLFVVRPFMNDRQDSQELPRVPIDLPGHTHARQNPPLDSAQDEGLLASALASPATARTSRADGINGRLAAEIPARRNRVAYACLASFFFVLSLATALRLWDIGNRPGWQADEPVYASVARNILLHGTLNDHIQYAEGWSPFLYHPPFYVLLLSQWFKVFGAGVPQARELSAVSSVVMFALLYWLIARLHNSVTAIFTLIFVMLDGWLIFIERISYIENTLMIFVVASFLTYQWAMRSPSAGRFIGVGALLGFTAIFKHTGFYVLPAVALHYAVTRQEGRKHLLLASTAAAVIGLYVAGMIWLFDIGRERWYLAQTLIQIQRVLGLRQSRGTLGSPLKFLYLVSHQYAVFVPSLVVAVAGVALLCRRSIQCLRRRSWEPVRSNSILYCWSVAGIVVFGVSQLHFPQYFALMLIPVYCFLWTELAQNARALRSGRAIIAAVILPLVLSASIWSFYSRVVARNDNVLLQVKRYVERHIPRTDTLITEEQIADEILQPWCSVARAGACRIVAPYAITYKTYLEPVAPAGDRAFFVIMRGATRLKTFVGFKETITVWKLR